MANQLVSEIVGNTDVCIAEFERACKALIETKYILADKKISALLQVIAKHQNLYSLIDGCMQGFDFKSAFHTAQIEIGNTVGLGMPRKRRDLIAFVFCLLLSFDTGQTDLRKFLHTFYYNGTSPSEEFEIFVRQAVVPFCTSILKEYFSASGNAGGAAVGAAHQAVAQEQAYDDYGITYDGTEPVEMPTQLDDTAIASILSSTREIIGIVARDAILSMPDREELLLMCEAFEQAVQIGAFKAIRTMYIALKYTIKCSPIIRRLEIQSANLENLLTTYGLN